MTNDITAMACIWKIDYAP